MGILSLIVRRLAAQRLLAAGLLVTMAFTIGVLVAGPIYADGSGRAIIEGTVAQALVDARNVRLAAQAGPSFDLDQANAAVDAEARDLPLARVIRQGATGAISVAPETGSPWTAQLAFREGAFDHLAV